jgi:glucokinase
VFQAASEGDALALSIVHDAVRKLGAAVAGLMHIFDPEVVILGGQVADAGAALIEPLEAEVYVRTNGLLGRKVPLVQAEVADKSGIIGAAALVLAK